MRLCVPGAVSKMAVHLVNESSDNELMSVVIEFHKLRNLSNAYDYEIVMAKWISLDEFRMVR